MSFTVITHDDRMPRDGGRRLGFIAGGKIFALPGVPLSLLVPPKPPASAKPSGIVLAEVPRARTWRNHCAHCGSKETYLSMERVDNGGTKSLYRCETCGKFTRDYDD